MKSAGKALALAISISGGLFLGLGLIELTLRALWPQGDLFVYEYKKDHLFHRAGFDNPMIWDPNTDAEMLRRKFPAIFGKRPFSNKHPFQVRVRINSLGMRDDREPSASRTDLRYRVLALGNSFTFGWPTELSRSYVKQVEKRLLDVEMINCSLVGASTDDLLRVYDKECKKYSVDVVIAQLSIDESPLPPDDIATDRLGPDSRLIRSAYRMIGPSLMQSVRWDEDGIPSLTPEKRAELEPLLTRIYDARLPLYHHSHLIRFIEHRWFMKNPYRLNNKELTALLIRERPADRIRRDGIPSEVYPTIRSLLALRAEVEKNGAKLLVLLTSSSFHARADRKNERPDIDALKKVLVSKGFELIDIKKALRDRKSPREIEKLYYADDHHPTDRGYEFIAEVVAEELSRVRSKN